MILDYLFTIGLTAGQAASALLIVYGAFLVLMPARKRPAPAMPEQEMLLAKY